MAIGNFLHKLFGTTPGKGVQPKEAIAYSVTGFGQNFICTIIGSYLTIFMTDALLFGAAEKGQLHIHRRDVVVPVTAEQIAADHQVFTPICRRR